MNTKTVLLFVWTALLLACQPSFSAVPQPESPVHKAAAPTRAATATVAMQAPQVSGVLVSPTVSVAPTQRTSPEQPVKAPVTTATPPSFSPFYEAADAIEPLDLSPTPIIDQEVTVSATVASSRVAFVDPSSVEVTSGEPYHSVTAASGFRAAPVKIGFHVGVAGNRNGLGEWMRQLDAAGIPFFLKSADEAGTIYEAQKLAVNSGVPHTLVYRSTIDRPDYSKDPVAAARGDWYRHLVAWPQELDPALVWMETVNEVDRNQIEWLGLYFQEQAQLAIRDGRRLAAFSWSSGEPEAAFWSHPAVLGFLRVAAQHPDLLAVATHEYSYILDGLQYEYPFRLGRFQWLFLICDQYDIPRPTVLITEWGWTLWENPEPAQAIRDIAWASRLYAMYPEVKGAAIWYLGSGFKSVDSYTQRLIAPLTDYSLSHHFLVPETPVSIDPYLFVEEWHDDADCRWCYQIGEGR